MAITFDFHTLSFNIKNTLDEYTQATGIDVVSGTSGVLGLNLADILVGDRSRFLRFRHEHSHFTSFLATGLADLSGVFTDYLHVMLDRTLRVSLENDAPVQVPLVPGRFSSQSAPPSPLLQHVKPAWEQVNTLRAFLFGFGTRTSLRDLTALNAQDEFWELCYDDRFRPIIQRFYDVASRLSNGADVPSEARAVPLVQVNKETKSLSARSVMEAYALTIEVIATHFVKIETDVTVYESPTVRDPGPLYTVALEYALARIEPTITLSAFLAGRAPRDVYYLLCATTFAAMQVPVLQLPAGSVYIAGDVNSLSVSRRFKRIVDGIAEHTIRHPPLNPKNIESRDATVLEWVQDCYAAVGDTASEEIYGQVMQSTDEDASFVTATSATQSLIELSWAARANYMKAPVEYIYDAGLFAEHYPCQPRYIRTSDNKVVMMVEKGKQNARYLTEHAVPVLEAATFGDQWDAAWAKLPEVEPQRRVSIIEGVFVASGYLFGYTDPDVIAIPPSFTLR
jgi:hypothetical protein